MALRPKKFKRPAVASVSSAHATSVIASLSEASLFFTLPMRLLTGQSLSIPVGAGLSVLHSSVYK